MTSQLPTAPPPETEIGGRPRRRRWLAAILAAALAFGGSVTAAAPAFADGAPTVTVTEAPREGGTVTVAGSGFKADGTGIYVGIGSAASAGFYTASITEAGTVWVATGLASTATRAPMNADGSFSLELAVPAAGDTELAVFTSRAHGGGMMGDLTQDTKTPVAYAAAPEEPGTEEPGTEEPGTEEPGTEEPGTEEPGTEEPGTEEPGTEEPGTEEPGTEEPVAAAPSIVVSKVDGLDPHGETVTITGSGFVPNGAATTGTRPPLAGKFTGTYIAFGAFADVWAPSTGAVGATRPAAEVRWGVHEADLATIGGASKGGIVIAEDGTFETTLTVSYDYAGALADGNYGIYTYPGGGAKNAEFETFTPITFKPGVFVSKTADLDPFGDTVTVKGVGFTQTAATTGARPPLAGKFSGAYVAFGAFADAWAPSTGAAAATRPTGDVKWGVHAADLATIGGANAGGIVIDADGTFETELHVSAAYANLKADGTYGIYTYPGGGAKYAPFETATTVSFAPKVTVSKTSELDPAGETVTVRGAGFLPAGSATTGTRPPLAGKFTGAYVVFGSFADGWQPSTGGASALRKVDAQKWAVQDAELATIGGANAGGIAIGTGGTFETTLTVREFEGALANGSYGVYTYPGGGAKYAPFETATPLEFAEPVPVADPKLTVSPSTDVDSTVSNTFTVSGTGFIGDGAKNGAYVLIGEEGVWDGSGPLPSTGWLVQGWVMPQQITDGAFTTTLTVAAGKLDPAKRYVVASSAAHGLSVTDRTLDAFAPITVAQVAPVIDPKLTVSPSTDVDSTVSNTFTVSGTGFIGDGAKNGAYVLIGEEGVWDGSGPLPSTGWLVQGWVMPQQITDGAFTTTLTVAAGKLDPAKRYVVASSAAHGLSATDRTLDAFAPITVASIVPTGPTLSVTPSTNVDGTVSNTFTVTGAGYTGFGASQGVYVLIGEDGIWSGEGPLVADGWLAQGWVMPQQIVGGTFSTTLTVTAGKFDSAKDYVAASSAAHGLSVTDRSMDAFASITVASGTVDPVDPVDPEVPVDPSVLKLVVSPSKDLDGAKSNVLTVTGSGYTGASAAQGVYVVFGEKSVWAGNGPLPADGWIALEWVRPDQISKGAFTVKVTVPAGKLDAARSYVVATSAAHGLSQTDRSLDVFAPVTVKAGTKPDPTTPTEPTTPTKPTTPPVVAPGTSVDGGSLSWGVSERFVAYIGGPIANGSITVSGATRSGGAFQFGQSGGDYNAGTGRGTAEYSGSVSFRGHGGLLDLTFADPVLRVTSPQSGVLSVAVNGSRVDLASVDLGAASTSVQNGATRFANAPVSLLATGVSAFDGFYGAGQVLAPLTAVIGSPAAAPAGDSGTVVSAASTATASTKRDIPATPPATTGIVLDTATLAALGAGETVTVTAAGFEANEEDIAAVVYSTPIVLADDLSADAAGNVTWTGSIPASLEPGVHTLTFQGSTNVGVEFTVPVEKAGVCKVTAGSLDWGFKESFRSYLTSGIANGDWTLSGTTEDAGVFTFVDGSGSLDESGRGVLAYTGAVEFTGHDGALDTTIANPKVELDGDGGAFLLLDVTGTTQDGQPIDLKSVRFAELELGDGVAVVDGVLNGEATAVLTADGSAAFGTYPAGEALDPVSFTATVSSDCVVAAPAAVEAVEADSESAETEAVEPISETGSTWWIWALSAALLVIVLAIIAVLVIRSRRNSTES
ncbi:HtaA domain-containing protein [Agromyces allii]|uniref:HtaA domain-containing protein n=2 Tax=Agromyces allii TaxID=393607 RepID=UPI0012FCA62D|nr:HtaA domain-containing protein [Agromyces allii]